ncbi:MAG: PIG-L family deacetylase, partial [Bacteroidota bacterium]
MNIHPVWLLLLSIFLNACSQPTKSSNQSKPTSPQTILAIFAHPDDETTVGPILAKYSKTADVYLILATDGFLGVTEHAGIPAGDSLVKVREKEAACSCAALGIHPPIFFGLPDALGLDGSLDFYQHVPVYKEKLMQEIQRLKPDVIITFGPDGDSGHPDHRLVGA